MSILCNNLNSIADDVTYKCPINGARLQVHLNNLTASIPTATNMAVSVLRLTVVWGLLVLILTCQAGKYLQSQLMHCAVVSHDWRKSVAQIQNIKGREGNFGHCRKSTGLGDKRQTF